MSEVSPTGAEWSARMLPSWAGSWAKDSALLLVSQGLTLGATSLSAILVARHLQPAEWGIFSAFFGLSLAFSVFVGFGLATWLLRELSRLFAAHGDAAEERARQLMAASTTFAVAATTVVVSVGIAGGFSRGERGALLVALSSLLLYGGLFASANVLESYLRARRRLRRVVAASILEKYVLVMLVIGAIVTGCGIWGIGIAYVVAGVLRLSLLGWSVFGRVLPSLPTPGEVRVLLRRSLPFAFTSGALTVVPRLDALVLLGLSATAAGYFSLGDRILAPIVLLPVIGASTLYPFLARRVHRATGIWGLAAGFGICGGMLAVVGLLASPFLVPLLFGHRYEPAIPAVRLMLLSLPFIYAANPLLAYGYSCGRERAITVVTLGGSLAGSSAILTGQVAKGVSGAAGGMLLRQVLLLGAFAWIAVAASRNEVRGSDAPFPPLQTSPS